MVKKLILITIPTGLGGIRLLFTLKHVFESSI